MRIMKKLLFICTLSLMFSTASLAQFWVKGTWVNNARQPNGHFRIANKIEISDNNFSKVSVIGSGTFRKVGDGYGEPSTYFNQVTFIGHQDHVVTKADKIWDNVAKRHIIIFESAERRNTRNNRLWKDIEYYAYAFYHNPNNLKQLIVVLRQGVRSCTIDNKMPQIHQPNPDIGLYNSLPIIDSVVFNGLDDARTLDVPSSFTNISSPIGQNGIEGVRVTGLPSNLGSILTNKLNPSKTQFRLVITGFETLTTDDDRCNGQVVSEYRNKAEYLGVLQAWIKYNASCNGSGDIGNFGNIFNFPASSTPAVPNALILEPNKKHSVNISRNITISAGQFNNTTLVIGGFLNEIDICTALEIPYTSRTVQTRNGCATMLFRDMNVGANYIDIKTNRDTFRIHFEVSEL
jgi:hypothetical protein